MSFQSRPTILMRGETVFRNSGWMMAGQGARLAVQALYFLLLARTLGAEQYGAFAATVALTWAIAPLSGVGGGLLLIESVSKERGTFADHWGRSIVLLALSGAALLLPIVGLHQMFFRGQIPLMVVIMVSVGDLWFARFAETAAQAFQAFSVLRRTALIYFVIAACRCVAALTMWLVIARPTANEWAFLYLLGSVASAGVAAWLVSRDLGAANLRATITRGHLRQGIKYALNTSAQTIHNDADKALLGRLASLDIAGVYSAGYRIIELAFAPIRSLSWAALPGFFQQGAGGISGSTRYAFRLIMPAAAYALVAALILFFIAPAATVWLLGPEFGESAKVLRWLAPLPFIRCFCYFPSDALTGAGFQALRTTLHLAVAAINVGLNVWLIPLYAWRGAAAATLLSEGILAVAINITLLFFLLQGRLPQTSRATDTVYVIEARTDKETIEQV